MRERLWEVAQRLPAQPSLLGVEAKVVAVPQHLLEEQPGVGKPARIGTTRPGERLNEPEAAQVEGALVPRQPVWRVFPPVAAHQPIGGQPAPRRRAPTTLP